MATYLVSLSLLIAAVLLIRWIFRKTVSPRAIYALWLVVVIRMLLPIPLFHAEVHLPAFFRWEASEQTQAPEALPDSAEVSGGTAGTHEPSTPTLPPSTSSAPSIAPADPPDTATPDRFEPILPDTSEKASKFPAWTKIATVIWAGGASLTAIWFSFTFVVFHQRLRRDRKLHTTVGRTKIYVSESTSVPCIAGLIPAIYITPETAGSQSERLIILHERIHLRHGDHVWSAVRALSLILHWYNPLVWIAAMLSKQDAELACDYAISAKLNEEARLTYAHILLDTIPQKHRYAVGLGSAPMKERILMLTTKQKNRWLCLLLAVILTVSAAGCSFVSLGGKTNDTVISVLCAESTEYPDKEPYTAAIGKGGMQDYLTFEKGLTYYRRDYTTNRIHQYTLTLPDGYTDGNICFSYAGGVSTVGDGNGEIHFVIEAVQKDETKYLDCYFTLDAEADPVGNLVMVSMEELTKEEAAELRGVSLPLHVGELASEEADCLPHGVETALFMAGIEGLDGTYYLFESGLSSREFYLWEHSGIHTKYTLPLPDGYTSGKIVHAVSESGEVVTQTIRFYMETVHNGETVYLAYSLRADADTKKYTLQTVTQLYGAQKDELTIILNTRSVPIYLCDDVYRDDTTPTYGNASVFIPTALTGYTVKDCQILLCTDGCDPTAVLSRAYWGYAPAWPIDRYEEYSGADGWPYPMRRYLNEVPEEIRQQMEQQGAPEHVIYPREYLYLLTLDETHYAYIVLAPTDETAEKPENEVQTVNEIMRNTRISLQADSANVQQALSQKFAEETVMLGYKDSRGVPYTVSLRLKLPKGWRIAYDYGTYEMIPFAEYADLYNGDDCVGGIGFLQYELPEIPEGEPIPPSAIFSQLTLSSACIWNIHRHFDTVTAADAPFVTALTSVLYPGDMFEDKKERTDSAIVTYHPEYQMYFALQFNDGIKDRTVLTEEELRYVAESMDWISNEPSTLYRESADYLNEEFHRVFDPYYDIQSLTISGWQENGNEATFLYTMSHLYHDSGADDEPIPANFNLKIIMKRGKIDLYHNASPNGTDWQPISVDDFVDQP